MDEEKPEKVYWLADSDIGKKYTKTTWYRSVGIQKFLETVEKDHKIVAILAEGNNIGFVIDKNDK